MTQANITVPAFDPVTRAPFYQEVMVQSDNVDPTTGVNNGLPDTTTALDFVVQSQPHIPAVVNIVQVGIVPDGQANAGARVLRISPGVMQTTDSTFTWSVICSVHGAPSIANTIKFSGSTPPPPSVAGVSPVGSVLTASP